MNIRYSFAFLLIFFAAQNLVFAQTQPPRVIDEKGGAANGLAGVIMKSEGNDVWPPKGAGCERYVKCCEAATPLHSAIGLACQLSAATNRERGCETMVKQIKDLMVEMGVKQPAACDH